MAYYDEVQAASELVAAAHSADIVIFNGDIDAEREEDLISRCNVGPRADNVVLLLCTSGGLPDAAYRMSRYFQSKYTKFTVVVCGKCKSAGTLLTLGAHEIVMSDRAELGPLDIQLGKKDAFFEDGSGLTVVNAISEIQGRAYEIFEDTFVKLILRTKRRVTLKTATNLANEMAVGLVTPIISQIDPMHLGEVSRAMRVGREYGDRLSHVSQNLRDGTLHKLVNGYPSHGFVIDRQEASELFVNVRIPTEAESSLIDLLGANSRVPKTADEQPICIIFRQPPEVQNANHDPENAGEVEGEPEAAIIEVPGGDPAAGHPAPANDPPGADPEVAAA